MSGFCNKCGVELEDRVSRCPLCGRELTTTEIGDINSFTPYPEKQNKTESSSPRTFNQNRKIILEIFAIVFISSIVVVGFIDLKLSGEFTWSYYPVFSIIVLWLFTFYPLVFFRKPILMILLYIITIAIFLTSIDYIDGKADWILHIGFPLVLWITIISGLTVFLSVKAKEKGTNIAGFILLSGALMGLGIESIISYFQSGTISFSWSLIVLLACIPTGILMLYLHYRLKTPGVSKKHFHF